MNYDQIIALTQERDALAAQLAQLRQHLGTLTPGGSHTCITCAAHCVAIGDLEAELDQAKRHKQTRGAALDEAHKRIGVLEAALRDIGHGELSTKQKLMEFALRTLAGDGLIPCPLVRENLSAETLRMASALDIDLPAETKDEPGWHSEGSKVLGEMADAYTPKISGEQDGN